MIPWPSDPLAWPSDPLAWNVPTTLNRGGGENGNHNEPLLIRPSRTPKTLNFICMAKLSLVQLSKKVFGSFLY